MEVLDPTTVPSLWTMTLRPTVFGDAVGRLFLSFFCMWCYIIVMVVRLVLFLGLRMMLVFFCCWQSWLILFICVVNFLGDLWFYGSCLVLHCPVLRS